MIKPEQIPDEVMLAAREAYMRGDAHISTNMRAAIAAALSAWQGVRMMVDIDTGDDAAIILPISQETHND